MNTENERFLTPELASPRDKAAINLVTTILGQSIPENWKRNDPKKPSMTISGTHAEIFDNLLTPSAYRDAKAQLTQLDHPNQLIREIAKETANSDPDFDIHVWNNRIRLPKILKNFIELLKNDRIDSDIDRFKIDAEHDVVAMLRPVSEKNDKPLLNIQVIYTGSKEDINCFHYDLSKPPVTRRQKKNERRLDNGGIAGAAQSPMTPALAGFVIEKNRRLEKINNPGAVIKINPNRGPLSIIIESLRNTRKISSAINSSPSFRDRFNGIFADIQTNFHAHAIATNLLENIREWSYEEIKNIYREILVSAAHDPRSTIVALHQSGLDKIIFDQEINPHLMFQVDNTTKITQFINYFESNQIDFTFLINQWTDSAIFSKSPSKLSHK